ncbi:MAG: class I SAM-dependent methyltransferase [Gammaproteobacteria bacterium]|nr:class I SAM-dependent methyltransferase [Gammaproteobacteria bacterium]
MTFKDHFSGHAQAYADARPSYPDELFEFLYSECQQHDLVWDCATGNGQAAMSLAKTFKRVIATDGSAEQIKQAQPRENIEYRQMTAEQPLLNKNSCDLITVAQALHWFDTDVFFEKAKTCLKPEGVLAVWCYAAHQINESIDAVVEKLYGEILGEYWPPERRLVERYYRDVSFPFATSFERDFVMTCEWNLQQLCGYFTSWSALQRYRKKNGSDPLQLVIEDLREAWGTDPEKTHVVTWPLKVKLARM